MLDIAPSEFVLIAAVAIVCIGPKDMPRALRAAGRWVGKMRRVSGHFRAGMENLIREAELEEMEKTWRAQNEAIMRAHPAVVTDAHTPPEPLGTPVDMAAAAPASPEPGAQVDTAPSAPAHTATPQPAAPSTPPPSTPPPSTSKSD